MFMGCWLLRRSRGKCSGWHVPAIFFMRVAFSDQCWHNPDPGAGIVIDDPLLKKNYGFISFPSCLDLPESMDTT